MKIEEIGDIEKYKKNFSDDEFWDKVKKYAKVAGKNVLESALTIFFTLKDDNTPMKVKGLIIGALGYFILPIDVVPDVIPVIGYGDDLSVLMWVTVKISEYIKEEHRQKAKEVIQKLFN